MRYVISLLACIFLLSAFSGCLIRTRSSGRSTAGSCPPAHHWDGYSCVHNGRGRGKVRDHRR